MTASGHVPHFKASAAPLVAFETPEGISGEYATLYQSEDGRRLAGSFRESGVIHEVMPFDEFIYVVSGSTKISVKDGDSFTLEAGDCCYLRTGQDVTFEHSDDFQDVVVLISEEPIDLGGA